MSPPPSPATDFSALERAFFDEGTALEQAEQAATVRARRLTPRQAGPLALLAGLAFGALVVAGALWAALG